MRTLLRISRLLVVAVAVLGIYLNVLALFVAAENLKAIHDSPVYVTCLTDKDAAKIVCVYTR